MIPWHFYWNDDVIQNGLSNLTKSHSSLDVNNNKTYFFLHMPLYSSHNFAYIILLFEQQKTVFLCKKPLYFCATGHCIFVQQTIAF